MTAAQKAAAAKEAFARYDTNGDGVIGFKELCSAMKDLAARAGDVNGRAYRFTPELVDLWFDSTDADKSSAVSPDEFAVFYRKFTEDVERVLEAKEAAHTKPPNVQFEPIDPLALAGNTSREAMAHVPLSRLQKMLRGYTHTYQDHHHEALSDIFVEASSGHKMGIHKMSTHGSAGGLEKLKEQMDAGRIDRIKLTYTTFCRLCKRIHIDTSLLQASFWRVVERQGDGLLTFQELLVGLAPLICGSEEQRCAFMFLLYDVGGHESISITDMFRLQAEVPHDCAIEKDLVAFFNARGDKKKLSYDDYKRHVAENGECELAADIAELLDQIYHERKLYRDEM